MSSGISIGSSVQSPSFSGNAMNKQTFGAAVVSGTLDTLNSRSGPASGDITDKQSMGAAVVSKSLDYLNSGSGSKGAANSDYQFQKDVLAAGVLGKGGMVNGKV